MAHALEAVDPSLCNGYQLVEVLTAQWRQVCWHQAQLLSTMHELASARPGAWDGPPLRGYRSSRTGEEIGFALAWTQGQADGWLATAWAAIDEQPALHQAMAAGVIDLRKAQMILDEVSLVDREQAAAVIAKVLPTADKDTIGQLRARIRRLMLTIDPDLVYKRYKKDVRQRRVVVNDYKNGTSSIVGQYLPTDQVAAAFEYLTAVATATYRAGDPDQPPSAGQDRRTITQIRADVFLALLAGVDPTLSAAEGGPGAVKPAARKGTVHLTVELETLLCRNDHPGELEGFGPIVADIARQVADDLAGDAMWGFVITDRGEVIHESRFNYRPTAAQKSFVRARDRYCRAPNCRRPARQCDLDHVRAWEDSGITHEDNLVVACRRHHGAKHDGVRLYRTEWGLVWISPHGHAHPVSFGREFTPERRRLLQDMVNRGEAGQLFGPGPLPTLEEALANSIHVPDFDDIPTGSLTT